MNVPAGEFKTEKVELSFPERLLNIWITQGVGIVKITDQELGNKSPTIIQELIEYQIPTEKANKMQNKQ
jgi:hypothetical protein